MVGSVRVWGFPLVVLFLHIIMSAFPYFHTIFGDIFYTTRHKKLDQSNAALRIR